jgi:hypothetical protein
VTTRKTHDADLCERIREMEKRVEELEARPQTTWNPTFTHYCYPGCPQHSGTASPYPWTIWYGTTSDSNITLTSGLHQQ